MPTATVRGVTIKYQLLGGQGSWVALSPGGRSAMDSVQSLGQRMRCAMDPLDDVEYYLDSQKGGPNPAYKRPDV